MIIRPSRTLGGTGGSIARELGDYRAKVAYGLEQSPSHEVLIEQSVEGWKEFELEVMRDTADNVVIICSIENLDPMGVHTGDSITVAPAQTLTDKEYQLMRDARDSDHPRNRRRHRRIEHPVCDRAGDRADGRDRDEPARVAELGAGVEGDRISNREDRGAAGGRLPARRDSQRHHAHDAVMLRADHRLRRHQDSALHVREVPRRGRRAGTADEVGGRGDGDWADLQGVAAKGAALARDRIARTGERALRAIERSRGADSRAGRDGQQPSLVPSGGRAAARDNAGGSLPAEQDRSVVYRRGRGAGDGGKARRARALGRSVFPGVQADGIFRSANR